MVCLGTHAQNTKVPTVKEVIDTYIDAIGGKEKALQVHSYSSVAIGQLNDKEIHLEKKLLLPNFYYTAMLFEDQILSKSIFNGKKGKVFQGESEHKMKRAEAKKLKKGRSIFPEFNYYHTAKYNGIAKVNEETCHVLQVNDSKIYYSQTTGLKVKGSSVQEKEGQTFVQHLYFSNYVEIKGLLFPSELILEVGTSRIEFLTRSLALNTDVTEKDFEL